MIALTLMVIDLRSRPSGIVTVSDASEEGGGACRANSFTQQGRLEVLCDLGREPGRGRDKIIVLSLCDGIGGAMRAFELLGVEVALFAAAETDKRACRVTRARWPFVVELGDIHGIGDEVFEGLWLLSPHAELVFLFAGSPCQEVAGLNVCAVGLSGLRSGLAYKVVEIMAEAQKFYEARGLKVFRMLENVSSMYLPTGRPAGKS